MTEREIRERFAALCLSHEGAHEGDGSLQEIFELYNGISPLPRGVRMSEELPWCAAFVSAMAAKAGLLGVIPAECSCCAMIRAFEAMGRWAEGSDYSPAVGDIVFYDWDASGRVGRESADHAGVVIRNEDGILTVIEGNKNDAVGLRTIPVGNRCICGYGLPDYAAAAGEPSGGKSSSPAEKEEGTSVTVTARMLRQGDAGKGVRALQSLLNGLYGCGLDVDGEFGPQTNAALLKAQRAIWPAKADEWDGIAGSRTWGALVER